MIDKTIAVMMLTIWIISGWSAIAWYTNRHELKSSQKVVLTFYATFFGPIMWLEAKDFDKRQIDK